MKIIKRVFDFKGAPFLTVVFVALFIAESKRQLRKRKQLRSQRIIVNSMVAIPSFGLLRFLFLPLVVQLAKKNKQLQWGLNYKYNAHGFIKGAVAFLIMDYTNYLWHVLNHKIPFLWRFHVVHHSDRDLDVSTALRFHFGELIGSVFYRGAFVLLSGASALYVLLYEILFETATQFHHSNWKLPFKLEKNLNKVIVTPRMHGIHHSEVRNHTDSNYSVIFSFWDRFHATARLNVDQDTIVIGVPSYQNAEELTPTYLLKLPFTKIRQSNEDRNGEMKKYNCDKNILHK
jgi:sterol desaturase/sphingolipid hydroxylase (fatty acid hydroxylase superfamily)